MANEVYSFQENAQNIMDEEVVAASYAPVKKAAAVGGVAIAAIMLVTCCKSAKARRIAKKQLKCAKKAMRRF